jgi:ribonuclease E
MAKAMLINVTHPEESRVAIVSNGLLDGFEIETVQHGQLKGNIYRGIVRNVNASLQAAFVDFGSERDGFLPLDEVNYQVLPARSGKPKGHRIEDHLRGGLEVTVQVVKDGFGSKPPTLSTFISLPGRFLVLTPDSDAGGVSRKIESQDQRERLRKVLSELKSPEGAGLIVRTAGIDQTKTELNRDLRYLVRLWQNIQEAARTHPAPSLLYRERDLAIRTIRDYLTSEIEEIWIDDEDVFRRADNWFKAVMPTKRKMLKLYTGAAPLFAKSNVEDQIEQIFKRRVNLRSGGAIVIDSTEALTAIDVNSGKFHRAGNIEDTALQTNLEAAEEICRQLRLRDQGGIIVIDFIDMRSRRNTRAVEKVVRDGMKADKARHDITGISKLGLMEISRQRLKPTKTASTFVDCEACGGDGVVRAVESASLAALRKVHTVAARGDVESLRLALPTEVAIHLLNYKREEIAELERRHRCRIVVVAQAGLRRHESELTESRRGAAPSAAPARREESRTEEGKGRRRRRRGDRSRPGRPAAEQATTPAVSDEDLVEEPPVEELPEEEEEEAEAAEGTVAAEGAEGSEAGGKKRRRRRRGGRGRRGRSTAPAPAPEPIPAPEAAAPPPPPPMEILVPPSTGSGDPYFPPSMTGQAQEAPDSEEEKGHGGSWWHRFRRVLRPEDEAKDEEGPNPQ